MIALANRRLVAANEWLLGRHRRHSIAVCRQTHRKSSADDSETHVTFSNGRTMRISTGRLARMADGSAVVGAGDTSVMVTAVHRPTPKSAYSSFVPLTVDYRHKYSAAGRIPVNRMRREVGAPTEREILTARIIDRSVRPVFPKGYNFETQLVCNLLAVDGINDPDVLAVNSASAALTLSPIPWEGPVGAVRVCLTRDNHVITCPTRREMSEAALNCVVTCTAGGQVLMLEAFASEPVLEPGLLKTIGRAVRECRAVTDVIARLRETDGKPKRDITDTVSAVTDEHFQAVKQLIYPGIRHVFQDYSHDKFSRDAAIQAVIASAMDQLREQFGADCEPILSDAIHSCIKHIYAELVVDSSVPTKRCDGRLTSELRPITCHTDLFKPLHGSALFQRGQTQVLCSLTLDSADSAYRSDPFSALTGGLLEKNFMLHYEFPQYATNSTGSSSVGRREIGHGSLAERALRPIVPGDHPFTIRLNCEVLESNGSSSMASVCAGSLALMDAGVETTGAAAGVAMGLLKCGDRYKVLTDISGLEDHFGEMDFKIAGTKKAFTALQLDCKLREGLPVEVLTEAIQKAAVAKREIIDIMNKTLGEPRRRHTDPNRPVSESVEIPVHRRGRVMGAGGANVRKLADDLGVRLTQDADDVNTYTLFAPNRQALAEAKEFVDRLVTEPTEPTLEFGAVYTAEIVELRENGVMVRLYPSMAPALLHVSQLDVRKVGHPSALGLAVGQELDVKYFGRDPASGHMRLSRKVLQTTEQFKRNLIHEKRDV